MVSQYRQCGQQASAAGWDTSFRKGIPGEGEAAILARLFSI
jgi:hypothetical protein